MFLSASSERRGLTAVREAVYATPARLCTGRGHHATTTIGEQAVSLLLELIEIQRDAARNGVDVG